MFDQNFFTTSLPNQIRAKAEEGPDQPSVHVRLHSGQEYTLVRIVESGTGWVVFETYAPKGKKQREYSREGRKAGAPLYDFNRVIVPYGNISLVVVTLEPNANGMGFQPIK